jgi:phosphoribosylformimino-5-aminoimidazole carboxamide ribotide isomerase
MQVIPVIDLKNGIVVHARRGQRERYAALSSPLARSAAPDDVVAGLLAYQPFESLYVADLDAIAGTGSHASAILALAARHPRLTLLVDAGFADAHALAPFAGAPTIEVVLGSESIADLERYHALRAALPARRTLLSLDRGPDGPRGCAALFEHPRLWPARVIHMDLGRVGADQGPDYPGLEQLKARAGARAVLAAGGVRDEADLERLARMGIAGALVATAIHRGRVARHRVG